MRFTPALPSLPPPTSAAAALVAVTILTALATLTPARTARAQTVVNGTYTTTSDNALLLVGPNLGPNESSGPSPTPPQDPNNAYLFTGGTYTSQKDIATQMAGVTATINGGTFTGRFASLYLGSGTVTINGGTFTATGTNTNVQSFGTNLSVYGGTFTQPAGTVQFALGSNAINTFYGDFPTQTIANDGSSDLVIGTFTGRLQNNTEAATYNYLIGSRSVVNLVNTALAATLAVLGPGSAAGGTAFPITVTARTAGGNIPGSYGTIHFTSTDPLASLPADYTFTEADQGSHTFLVTLGTGGLQTVTATDTANGSVTGTSLPITVVVPDTTGPTITATASKTVLFPPNGKSVPVTVSGTITDTGSAASGVNLSSGSYTVTDSEGTSIPGGTFPIHADGSYSFMLPLVASRKGTSQDDRVYTITVTAKDNAGNTGTTNVTVTVPHDRGK